jgi:hypothetical protein
MAVPLQEIMDNSGMPEAAGYHPWKWRLQIPRNHWHLSTTLYGHNYEMCAICRCLPMSEYEELQLLNQLRRVSSMVDVPGAVRRLYRKLCVRRLKRERGMPLFNLDDVRPGRQAREVTQSAHPLTDVRILDRFQVIWLNISSLLQMCEFFVCEMDLDDLKWRTIWSFRHR